MADLTLNDEELLRYSRQIMLPKFDVTGQLALKKSTVLIVGIGGLGCPVALYLAGAGIGHLILVDDDEVEISNLPRQIAHTENRLGEKKVDSAQQQIQALNSTTKITTHASRLSDSELSDLLTQVDIVADCTDNFSTRQQINRLCLKSRTPLVSGAAIRMEGQITVFDARDNQSPCYHCLYSADVEQELTCSQNGVMSPLVGLIGSYQAIEIIKMLTNMGESLVGRVQLFDGMSSQWREFKLARDPKCAVCENRK